MTSADQIKRFAVLGNHLPRHCGIATFTTHLTDALLEQLPLPCGYTLNPDGDGINMYYGAADTSVALATGSIKQILGWLDRHNSA
jgi:hypothetical protein